MKKYHQVLAIDGPAGSGKSTVARLVAEALGWTLLDTGAIYRALAYIARQEGAGWGEEARLASLAEALDIGFVLRGGQNRVMVSGRDISAEIRTPEMSEGASRVSALPGVRAALLELQRDVARAAPVVAEGRDMGTVVFPAADPKVFLVASPEIRASRRHRELLAAGEQVSLEDVLAQQEARDRADSSRAAAPLRAAEDARTVDTSRRTIEEVVQAILAMVRTGERRGGVTPPRVDPS